MKPKILIVDDEKAIRESVSHVLTEEGYETEIASTGKEALKYLNENDYEVMITDLKMPEMDGIDLIKESLKICPSTSVIIITAHASVESAIEALRIGAFDYILKPFDFDDLILKVQRLLDHKELALENQALRNEVEENHWTKFRDAGSIQSYKESKFYEGECLNNGKKWYRKRIGCQSDSLSQPAKK
jgi:DNA-binding NtrC family response regulator